MSTDFFQSKKPWSLYKDMILQYYLTPYLSKVCSIGKPVVVFDCFAGPGCFESGEDGSPLIISKSIRPFADKGNKVSAVFIEQKKKYFKYLQETVKNYRDICNVKNESFEDSAKDIATTGTSNTVFVYIDPYGIKSLRFDILAGIYANIAHSSVEVLLNFNAASLVRNGRAALKYSQQDDDEEKEEELDRTMTPEDIDAIAGGNYWRYIVKSNISFSEKEEQCVLEYMHLMKQYFKEVCCYGIKEKYSHTIPKYRLIFGSRHPDALILMNDAICNARDIFLRKQCVDGLLLDIRTSNESHDPKRLRRAIFDILTAPISRKELIVRAMHKVFAEYKESEYKKMISNLLKEGTILPKSGKTRINDKEILFIKP